MKPCAAFQQRGVALFISLVTLALLTIFVLSLVNTSIVNTRVIGGMQSKQAIRANVQQAIEQVMSSGASFTSPAQQTLTVNNIAVNISSPSCVNTLAVPGYAIGSAAQPSLAPLDTLWEVKATATDPVTGANATIHQGVRMRLPIGSACP